MNATNWPTFNVSVFIAQMVELCSVLQRLNEEAMGSNPVEVPNFCFSGEFAITTATITSVFKFVFLQFISSSCFIPFTG